MTQSPALVEVLPGWVAGQRWYAGKPRVPTLRRVGGRRYADPGGVAGIDVWLARDEGVAGPGHPSLGRRWVYDAPHDPAYVQALLADILDEPAPYRGHHVLTGEQSNTSIIAELDGADPVIVKIFRTMAPGPNPDVEIPAGLLALQSQDEATARGHTGVQRRCPNLRARGSGRVAGGPGRLPRRGRLQRHRTGSR
jgi:hypothetical protein